MADKKHDKEFAQGKEQLDEIGRRLGAMFGSQNSQSSGSGFFSGLGSAIELLGKLAEQAEHGTLSSNESKSGSEPRVHGVYGFSVKSAAGEKAVTVEPFGNIRRDDEGKLVEVHEIREPLVDLFDEPGRLLVVAEVPGVEESNVRLELHDDILIISTEKGDPKYRKEVLLPASFSSDQLTFHCRNGVLEIVLSKDGKGN
jgi:HSP20 family protein